MRQIPGPRTTANAVRLRFLGFMQGSFGNHFTGRNRACRAVKAQAIGGYDLDGLDQARIPYGPSRALRALPKITFETHFSRWFHKAATIIWLKQSPEMGWQDYRAQHEPILYGWKHGGDFFSFLHFLNHSVFEGLFPLVVVQSPLATATESVPGWGSLRR